MAIRTVAMIGAGTQSRAIALLALRAGYRVVLEDFSISTLEEAEASIRAGLSKQAAVAAISRKQQNHTPARTNADSSRDAISNLSVCTGIEDAIRNADLIIETAADEMETKIELFTIFDRFAKPNAIFATTSRIHPIAEMAAITSCPERCIAFRFDTTIPSDRLTVAAGPNSSPGTIRQCVDFTDSVYC
jgi:3-hydroxybutyryl-CoA dehydrogenase